MGPRETWYQQIACPAPLTHGTTHGTTHATQPHAPTHGTTLATHRAGRCLRPPALAFLAALALLPATSLGDGAAEDGSGSPLERAPELVAEALFLCDPMPPGGRDLSLSVASPVSAWSPHLHAGASGAVALGPAWRGLVEVIAELGPGRRAVSAGPTLKVALSEGTALVVGALFPLVRGGAPPTLAFQVSQSI